MIVSVKAALRCGDRWVLLKNDRDEWELPGGRIDPADTTLEDTVRRECREELDVDVTVGALVGTWLFEVIPDHRVVIVCFNATTDDETISISSEHVDVGLFSAGELASLNLPDVYRNAIAAAS